MAPKPANKNASGTKNKSKGSKSKKGGKNVQKERKAPTLKQKLAKQSKIVKVGDLTWKPVEIPDNLGDYLGFMGLEELEGVDVQVVDGKPQFVQIEDTKKASAKGQDKKAKKAEVPAETKSEEEEKDDSEMEEEFTGFDDESAVEEDSIEEDEKDEKDELENSSFPLDLPLPDDNEINLPFWQDEKAQLSLNAYTLAGLNAMKFTKPTPIQKRTIPLAIEGKDIIGKATTGSGKTLAYGIPILEKYMSKLALIKENRQAKIVTPPTGIIFAPTRELAHQVVDHLKEISKFSPLHYNGIVSITGGLSIQKQERLLSHGPGILVATPGRFLELIEKSEELAIRLANTDMIVLDEADRLLQDGHFEEFEKILELFSKSRKKSSTIEWKWQTLVFSATFSRDLFGKLDKFQKKGKATEGTLIDNDEILQLLNAKLKFKDPKPALIDANPKEIVSGQITEALVECGPTERDLYLYYFLLMYKGTTLVFANSIDSVKRLVPFLTLLNIPAFALHSAMIQKQRLRSLERFKEASERDEVAVLIASDVAARGLDIPNIDHVVHYHLPKAADVYIHRSGRTARAGNEGVSVMFCSPQEASGPLKKLRRLVATSSKNTRLNIHSDVKLLPLEMDLVTQVKPRVALSAQLADATISSIATRKEKTWVEQAAEELGVDHGSDLEDFEDDILKKQRKRKESKALTKDAQKRLRAELRNLMSVPLRKNLRRSYLTSGLQNLAHQMVTGNTHKDVLGHEITNALDDLKTSGSKRAKKGGKK
ncbi:DEAD-domain-containing protein [Suhomyces tanzawaensis NRRL Y-17324]|uniref:RNA helicase n=1 Tax=Suhomyces tanzawaensis NRRL Y-17324 TaxID=984487 RepID=A0A1E4SEV9_9ASCO|nr:DEAD-domain-containing protein [Suhomyces tanzawaensis NRRL Y-17324]ODV78047.1 DEAD-domain-containing protein [Suhomyces tanzawaensis NRRL Y-17324]